jgi:hypothetical protein
LPKSSKSERFEEPAALLFLDIQMEVSNSSDLGDKKNASAFFEFPLLYLFSESRNVLLIV